MRVSYSGTSKLKIPEIFEKYVDLQEPCKQGTIGLLQMRPLRTPNPLCKWEGACIV